MSIGLLGLHSVMTDFGLVSVISEHITSRLGTHNVK